jgi:amidophosphoribosyltransferase
LCIADKCGVIGISSVSAVAKRLYFGLRVVQHRGQESAGITTFDTNMNCVKKLGLVHEVFNPKNLESLSGTVGIGHVRYSTTGSSDIQNVQPIMVSTSVGEIALAHNGDIVNAHILRDELQRKGWAFITTTDSEIIVRILANEISNTRDTIKSMKHLMKVLVGSYSLVILIGGDLYAMRDPYGIKPLCIGKLDDGYIVGSESVIIEMLNGEFLRDVEPGEIVRIKHSRFESFRGTRTKNYAHCMFEWVYFARPDSVLDGKLVYRVRKNIGIQLAEEQPVDADIVIPIPDSGRTHALGFAESSGIPYTEGLMKNRYVERTFIMPNPDDRIANVALKLNPIKTVIEGKRVVLVDDSIVRGTTMRKIIQMIRAAGAKEVHVRVGSPPIIAPCYLGIDMKTRDQFIATDKTVDEIAKSLTADSIGYLSIDGLVKCIDHRIDDICLGCLTGEYPVYIPGERLRKQKRLDLY